MHRVLYEEHHGVTLPPGIVVRHTCDVRMCINMDHLVEGTPKDNSEDMVTRGRQGFQYGEKHSDATLSDDTVLQILNAEGVQQEIADRFGINQSTVSRLKAGKRRKNMTCK